MSSIIRKSPSVRSSAQALRLTLGLLAGLLLAACGDPAVPEGPPAAPSDVSAVAGPGYVTVSWTDNSDDETGFEVYRLTTAPAGVVGVGPATSPSPQQDAEPLATLPANSTS